MKRTLKHPANNTQPIQGGGPQIYDGHYGYWIWIGTDYYEEFYEEDELEHYTEAELRCAVDFLYDDYSLWETITEGYSKSLASAEDFLMG